MTTASATHLTLLNRLRDGGDHAAWRDFADRYEELIRGFARRQGVQGPDADDVVQDVMLALTKAMPGFVYDASKGKFRSYLKTVVLHTIFARFRQNPGLRPLETADGTPIAGMPAATDADAAEEPWEAEWRQYHLRQAMRTIRAEFNAADVAAFEGYVTQARDAAIVARELGLSVDQVYQSKSRVLKRLGVLIRSQVEDEG